MCDLSGEGKSREGKIVLFIAGHVVVLGGLAWIHYGAVLVYCGAIIIWFAVAE